MLMNVYDLITAHSYDKLRNTVTWKDDTECSPLNMFI